MKTTGVKDIPKFGLWFFWDSLLAMAVYHLVLHTIAAIAVLTTIPHHRASVFLTGFSLTAVGCGWIAIILFIFRFS